MTYSPRVRIAILFFTLVVVMLGFGMIIPILPFYLEAFGGGGKEMGALPDLSPHPGLADRAPDQALG